MAQNNFTPIQLYYSTTNLSVPTAANLLPGEIGFNIHSSDFSLYAENSAGTVTRIMNNPAGLKYPTADGTSGQFIMTNAAGVLSFGTAATAANTLTFTNKTIAYGSNTLTGVQPTLVSGTNIKTINGGSLLGSGDLSVVSPNYYLKVSDQKASGTFGGTSLAADITQVRTLNTVETNTISGASLASNTVTLPAGTYTYRVSAPHYNGDYHKAFLYNSTDGVYTGIGTSESSIRGATVGSTSSTVSGQFTIASAKDFKIRHFTTSGVATSGLGVAVSSGQVEVYTVAEFWKVA